MSTATDQVTGTLVERMGLPHGRHGERASVNRPDADRVLAAAVTLEEQVRVGQEIGVARVDSCGIPALTGVEALRLRVSHLETRHQLEESTAFGLLLLDRPPLIADRSGEQLVGPLRHVLRPAHQAVEQRPRAFVLAEG